jgi:hypothetical protein
MDSTDRPIFLLDTDCTAGKIESKYSDDSRSEIAVPKMTKLTNTAVFLHDNAHQIESELQFLEKQLHKLGYVDQVLNDIKRDLHHLDTSNRNPNQVK